MTSIDIEKSKPILFNTEMVRAILDGRKTVTRRVVKDAVLERGTNWIWNPQENINLAPYRVGDILYIRETWNILNGVYQYRAGCGDFDFNDSGEKVIYKWRPSIHMPKEAARIFLKVTSVRAERLQNITVDGVKMEGIPLVYPLVKMIDSIHLKKIIELWDSTIKKQDLDKYDWNANPWVFVYEFEVIK